MDHFSILTAVTMLSPAVVVFMTVWLSVEL